MKLLHKILLFGALTCPVFLPAQGEDDLLSLLEDSVATPEVEYAHAAFKTNRVINLHSIEQTAPGVMDLKISHRFGVVKGGVSELFGLDAASMRFGFDFGLTPNLQIGVGRANYEKTYDGYFKYRLLRQSKGVKVMPVTLSAFASTAIMTIPFQNPDRENYFSSRMYYTYSLILGRKFSEHFTLQLSPTVVHRNLVRTNPEANDVYALGIALRQKLTKRIAINAEHIWLKPDQLAPGYRSSLSVGFDIETGGHVFQLHFTNSTSMIEKGFIAETSNRWGDGAVHFGFNVSRVFTIVKPKME